MLAFLTPNWLKIGGGAILGAIVAWGIAYNVGWHRGDSAGYARAQDEARARAMELIEQRNKDNAEITDLDAAAICRELGGVWLSDEGRCN